MGEEKCLLTQEFCQGLGAEGEVVPMSGLSDTRVSSQRIPTPVHVHGKKESHMHGAVMGGIEEGEEPAHVCVPISWPMYPGSYTVCRVCPTHAPVLLRAYYLRWRDSVCS